LSDGRKDTTYLLETGGGLDLWGKTKLCCVLGKSEAPLSPVQKPVSLKKTEILEVKVSRPSEVETRSVDEVARTMSCGYLFLNVIKCLLQSRH
jgi:hypothetical protein